VQSVKITDATAGVTICCISPVYDPNAGFWVPGVITHNWPDDHAVAAFSNRDILVIDGKGIGPGEAHFHPSKS